jgi:hypothetical protein
MSTSDARRRLGSWEAFGAWERRQPVSERDLSWMLRWLGESLALARQAGGLVEEPIEETAARHTLTRERLATLRRPG